MLKLNTNKNNFKITITILILLTVIVAAANFMHQYLYNQQISLINSRSETDRTLMLNNIAIAKEKKRNEIVYVNLPSATPIKALVNDYSSPDSYWLVVNKSHAISVDYVPANLKIPDVATRTDKSTNERSVRADIEEPLKNMFTAAAKDGNSLMIGSGYRPASLQAIYFNSYANSVGEIIANQTIARPGQSEHQTALAVDITTVARNCYLEECFESTNDGQWLANNSYKFGFILRYPKGKESITGYQYEPWHFRYVGIDLATALYESKLTLEEAYQYLIEANETLKANGAI